MTPEQLKLARAAAKDAIRTFCQSLGSNVVCTSLDGVERIYYSGISLDALSIAAVLHLSAPSATPDARVKEALDYIKMADNRLECEGCGQCVSVARSYLVEALGALSHQPGTGEGQIQINAVNALADTAEADIYFLLAELGFGPASMFHRKVVKSFREQIIKIAALNSHSDTQRDGHDGHTIAAPSTPALDTATVEACAKIVDDEAERILSKQMPTSDPMSMTDTVNLNLRMMASVLPDLAAAIRALAAKEGA